MDGLRRALCRVLMGLGLALLLGCDRIDTAEWREEVLLFDGRMLVLDRRARAGHYGFPNAKRGGRIDEAFIYRPLSIRWTYRSNESALRYDPVAFELIDDEAYLILLVQGRKFCKSRPDHHYSALFLQWQDGAWAEVSQFDFPVDRALANLSTSPWGHSVEDDYKGLIAWDKKRMLRIHPTPREIKRYGKFSEARAYTVREYFERRKLFCGRYKK